MPNSSIFEEIQCVTLDLDDTLWPVEPTINRAEQALYAWISEQCSEITNQYTLEEITAKRIALGQRREDIAHDVTQLRFCALRELAEEFNCGEYFAAEGLELFRNYRNQVEPYQHSESVLMELKQHFVLGAITNGNAQLQHISLGRLFDFAITAEQVGVSKPHRQMFLHASEYANIELNKIVHIGDSPQTDVLGALNAGCKAIWFNRKRQAWPGGQTPDGVIHCLSELPEMLTSNVNQNS